MENKTLELKDVFKRVGFGKVVIQIADRRPILIPRQKIEIPKRDGMNTVIYINEPILLKEL